MTELLYKDETYKIIGACFKVYNEMGCGFLEAVYQESLEFELEENLIPFESQKELTLHYFDKTLKQKYIPDFICYDHIIVEIKAAKKLIPEHDAQLFNYLKSTGMSVGLLVNFGSYPKLEYKRIVSEIYHKDTHLFNP